MPITTSTIINRIRRVGLDAEDDNIQQTEHYNDQRDIIPAINAGLEWLISVINVAFGAKKIGEEIFRELVKVSVFQTSVYSRINLRPGQLGHEVWTILAVWPKPITAPVFTPLIQAKPEDSTLRSTFSHVDADFAAKRLTQEEWIVTKNDPFEAGNEIFDDTCGDMVSFGYLSFADYQSATYTMAEVDSPGEIEVRPKLDNKAVSISYVKFPTRVVDGNSIIQFPETLANLLYEKSLQFISFKQGDGTTIFTVTERDINNLLQTIQ